MNHFQTAYELQQRLIAAQPEHPLAQKNYMSCSHEGYAICIDPDFLNTYPQNGIESQLKAFVGDLEKAIAQAQKKSQQPTA